MCDLRQLHHYLAIIYHCEIDDADMTVAGQVTSWTLDVLYVCDVIIKINVRYVIINRFLRYIQ